MNTLTDKLKETINCEQVKLANNINFQEFEKLVKALDQLGNTPKAQYSIPLVDTIGKSTYSLLNNSIE